MNIEVITPPTVEPVTVAEAFFHLKLTADPDADVSSEPQFVEVSRCIASSRAQCEQITRRAFVRQTLLMTRGPMRSSQRRGLQWYMSGGIDEWASIELLRPPFIEVVAVRYYDESNVLQTVEQDTDPDDEVQGLVSYYVSAGLVPKLCFTDEFTHPAVYLRDDAIQIEYVAGYPIIAADPEEDPPIVEDLIANVPANIKSAILLGVQLEFDRLSPSERTAIEKARDSLLSSFRVNTF